MKWTLLAAALAATFLLMIGSVKPFDLALAAALGAIATLAGWLALPRGRGAGRLAAMRPLGAPRFAAGVVIEITGGAGKTLAAMLRPGPERGGQMVETARTGRSEGGAAIDGLVICASPGTVVVDADERSQRMLVHTVEVGDPEQIRRDIERFYQRYQRSFLP